MKKIILITVLFSIALMMTGCNSSNNTSTVTPEVTPTGPVVDVLTNASYVLDGLNVEYLPGTQKSGNYVIEYHETLEININGISYEFKTSTNVEELIGSELSIELHETVIQVNNVNVEFTLSGTFTNLNTTLLYNDVNVTNYTVALQNLELIFFNTNGVELYRA